MNQPAQVPPQQDILVIYLTDSSDSEDEPEEPEAPPAPVIQALEDIPLPHREDLLDNVEHEPELFQDPDLENSPERLPRPQQQRPGESPLSDDTYAAFDSWDPYWIERHYNPKRRRFCNPRNASQSTAEE